MIDGFGTRENTDIPVRALVKSAKGHMYERPGQPVDQYETTKWDYDRSFKNPNEDWWKEQEKLGTLAVEMETHILYALAHKFKKEALSICTVADHLKWPSQIHLTSKQRETGFDRMMKSIFNSLLC